MALSRIGNASGVLANITRISQTGITLNEIQCTRHAAAHQKRVGAFHVTSARRYPDAPTLPLPTNVCEIFANETGRFTPERARDIAAPVLIYGSRSNVNNVGTFSNVREQRDQANFPVIREDSHVDSYDCFGAVSLNGSMQSNVPKPFCSRGKSMHLNMPGGQWARDGKYIAEDMQKSHYRSTKHPLLRRKLNKNGAATNTVLSNTFLQMIYHPRSVMHMDYSTNVSGSPSGNTEIGKGVTGLSNKEKFQRMAKDYGIAVVVVHISLALVSLGVWYTLVVSGVDLLPYIKQIAGEGKMNDVLSASSNFLIAYTIHKLTAPIRFGITTTVAPFVVQYLRRIGILKSPKIKST